MNEDVFNMSLRKFLKKVGITSQREIEAAVRKAIAVGTLDGSETLRATITLTVDRLPIEHKISSDIVLK